MNRVKPGAFRSGRGPLHQRVGPRLPARLRPVGGGPPRPGRAPVHRPDRHRHRPRPPRHRRAARPGRPGAVRHRVRPPEPDVPRPGGPQGRRQALGRGRDPRPQPRPGDHLRQQPQAVRGGRRLPRSHPAAPGRHLSRRPAPRGSQCRPGTLHGGRGRRGRRHQRLRHGRGQGQHPLGHPLQHAGHPGSLLPGSRPRRSRRPARRVRDAPRPRRSLFARNVHRQRVPARGGRVPRLRVPPARSTPTRSS